MRIVPNGIYRSDCLVFLERLESEQVTLAYIDAPWDPDMKTSSLRTDGEHENDELTERLREHLLFLGRVLQHIHRTLSPTGSVFFHSEPRLSGNIRLILDQVFGRNNFRTEIIWPRPISRDSTRPTSSHDTIFWYSKTNTFVYNPQVKTLSDEDVRSRFQHSDDRGPFMLGDLTSSILRPSQQFVWKNCTPPAGRSWRYSIEKLNQMDKEGRIYQSTIEKLPRLKMYLDEHPGIDVGSQWSDIAFIIPYTESFSFPSQKPLSLLSRIIQTGSNIYDLILDPFCGTGTTLVEAQANNRKWLGCDLSSEAYEISVNRLEAAFGLHASNQFSVGEQHELEGSIPVISNSYRNMITGLNDFTILSPEKFILNQPVAIEETRYYEFKDITGKNPVDTIKNAADEYVVAFLNNQGGGHIYWGIRDIDRVVLGVYLTAQQRDEIRRKVSEKLFRIQPAVSPSAYRIEFHQVYEVNQIIPDRYIVEIIVPQVISTDLYFTGGNDAYIKTDAGKKKLTGPEIQDEILRRLRK